jgi:hypothetical protein
MGDFLSLLVSCKHTLGNAGANLGHGGALFPAEEFSAEWISWLAHQWDACLNAHGTVFNGVYFFTQNP